MKVHINIEKYDIIFFNKFNLNSLNDAFDTVIGIVHFRSFRDNDNAFSFS